MLTRYVSGKLNKQTGIAQPDMKGIEDLSFVEPVGGNIALAQRRHSEIDERTRKLCTA